MKAIERLFKYLDFKGIPHTRFEKTIGISNGYLNTQLKRNADIGEGMFIKIIDNCLDMNPVWLLTGNDEMIKKENYVAEPSAVYKTRTDNNLEIQQIPLYNMEASAGIVSLFKDQSQEAPIDFISIPNLPKCDGAIYVTGDSMYPLLKSGDIVMYKQINDLSNVIYIWGEMYLVSLDMDDEEYVTVKYIQKSEIGEDHIKLVSMNTNHQPIDVPKNKVKALALVKGSIRINSMI